MAGTVGPEEGCRTASVDDVSRLAALAEQAVAELRPGRGGEVWSRTQARRAPFEPRFTAEIADPTTLVLVGTLDGSVVGYAVVHEQALADGGSLGVIDDLYTEPLARGVGVGEQLMDALLAWCTERGFQGVDGLALPGDRHTKNYFEANGLVARAIVVHRVLP